MQLHAGISVRAAVEGLTRLRASRVRMLCVQMLRFTRYWPTPWMRMALQAALASQSLPIPKMITSVTAAPRDLHTSAALPVQRQVYTAATSIACMAYVGSLINMSSDLGLILQGIAQRGEIW